MKDAEIYTILLIDKPYNKKICFLINTSIFENIFIYKIKNKTREI